MRRFLTLLYNSVAQIQGRDFKSKIVPWIVVCNNRDLPIFASSHACITISQTLLVVAATGMFHPFYTGYLCIGWVILHDYYKTILLCPAGICIGKSHHVQAFRN
jgi:hypothetical protein